MCGRAAQRPASGAARSEAERRRLHAGLGRAREKIIRLARFHPPFLKFLAGPSGLEAFSRRILQ